MAEFVYFPFGQSLSIRVSDQNQMLLLAAAMTKWKRRSRRWKNARKDTESFSNAAAAVVAVAVVPV